MIQFEKEKKIFGEIFSLVRSIESDLNSVIFWRKKFFLFGLYYQGEVISAYFFRRFIGLEF